MMCDYTRENKYCFGYEMYKPIHRDPFVGSELANIESTEAGECILLNKSVLSNDRQSHIFCILAVQVCNFRYVKILN